jgi:cell wall-associated NlpC family hydrolase
MPSRRLKINLSTISLLLMAGLMLGLPACKRKNTDGKPGWFAKIFRSKPRKTTVSYPAEVSKIIDAARSYMGTPHRDGGTNRYGIDCSALMQNAFQAGGVSIPRTSRQQSETGNPVDRKDLRPGDLVFFADRKIGTGITHVGLVTEILPNGDVKFIHTSSRLGVTENLLSSSYFAKTYAKARRPL